MSTKIYKFTSLFLFFLLVTASVLVQDHHVNAFVSSSITKNYGTSASIATNRNNEHEMKLLPNDELMTRSQLLQQNPLVQIISFASAFRIGARISVINQPQMPKLLDTSSVGSTVTRIPSGARVRLFYPTSSKKVEEETSMLVAPYCTDGRQTSDGMAGLVGFRQLGLSFLLAHLATASSGCIQDSPTISSSPSSKEEEEEGLPLLIYSHGYGGNMDMATYFFRTMASKGIIIAAVEHTDGTASSTVLKNGQERKFNQYFMTGRQQLARRASELLEAVEYIPEMIETNYTTAITNIMLGGHSYGCPSAIMAANGASADKTQIDGLILHDPALGMGYGMLPPNGSTSRVPTISYTSDEYNRANVRYGDLTLHVKGCFHGNFVDAALWAPSIIMRTLSLVIPAAGPADPITIHEQLADSALAFLKSKDPFDPKVQIGDLFEFIR